MPYTTPTLDNLRTQGRTAFQARIPGADLTSRRSVLRVISDVNAGGLYTEYRALAWIFRQLFISQMEGGYLDIRAGDYNMPREGASAAAGNAIFTGTSGIAVPINTLLQSSDGTQSYATQAAGTLASGTLTVPVLALTLGSAGNADPGSLLQLSIAIAGVSPSVTVDPSGLNGGTDIESDANFRTRLLARIQNPPQGGAAADYVAWTKLTAGVTRAWVYPLYTGPGTVGVTFVFDGRTNIFPLSGDVTAMQAAVAALAPVTAVPGLTVFTPTPTPVNVNVHNLTPNTTATQAAVVAALASLFASQTPGGATYGDGVSAAIPGGTLFLEQMEAALNAATGVGSFDLTAPSADQAAATGHILTLGTVTFV